MSEENNNSAGAEGKEPGTGAGPSGAGGKPPAGDPSGAKTAEDKLAARVEHSEKLIAEMRKQLLALSAVANSSCFAVQTPADKELLTRLEQNEKMAADLKRELLVLATAPAPAPVMMPVHPDKELMERILFSEKAVADLRQELEVQREQARAYFEASVTREELQKVDFKAAAAAEAVASVRAGLQDQGSVFAVAKRGMDTALAELATLSLKVSAQSAETAGLQKSCAEALEEARLSEKAAVELKQRAAAEAEKLRGELSGLAAKEDVDRVEQKAVDALSFAEKASAEVGAAVVKIVDDARGAAEKSRADLQAAMEKMKAGMRAYEEDSVRARAKAEESAAALAEMMRNVSEYTLKFTDIEHSCKLALAEMEGHLRELARKAGDGKFEAHMGDSVGLLKEKLGALEKSLFSSIGELAGRLTSDEVMFRKIFSEAEERVRKNLEPELEVVSRKFAEQAQKIDWLTQEYDVITKRRLRALEAKSASYDALMEKIRVEDAQKGKNQ